MSAIIVHTAIPPPPPPPNEQTPLLAGGGATSPGRIQRERPLKDSLSTTRFVIICAGIWSSNLAFAFQSTAIPTLAPVISSAFNHAELAAYLGSIFSLTSAAVIPVYGVSMDSLGRSFAMIAACSLFGIGCAMCAISPNIWALIAARAFSGVSRVLRPQAYLSWAEVAC